MWDRGCYNVLKMLQGLCIDISSFLLACYGNFVTIWTIYVCGVGMEYFVHKSACLDENVSIGKGCKIWHFCHILEGSVLGDGVSVGQNCVIGPNVSIGRGSKIQNNVSLYEGVECEEEVFLGPSMVFTNVMNPRAFINRRAEFRKTYLRRGCSVGANATLLCGISIGEYAFVGAGAVVLKDVPAFGLVVGNPARLIGFVDKAGVRMEFVNGCAVDSYDGTRYTLDCAKMEVRYEN